MATPGRLVEALADRYRIERELGQGGMATVYLAEDLRHGRRVALKVLKPELAAVLGADRFVIEIRTTAALQHPHILPLFDSGTADGFLYYVMPFIEGETLRDKLNRETQLGVDEAVRIAREVADALAYAHGKGVIHRDIKPENILIQNGRPMVADFGIALAVSAAAGGRMTETGLSLGTPHYMSPEQATADKEISARSDVFSLASVLYEMLSGEPPHTGGSAQQVIMRILADTARPVSELRKSVPPNVEAALMRALEKLPADRFEGARAFAEALANPGFRFRESAATQPRSKQSRRWLQPVAGVALLVAGVVAGSQFARPSAPGAAAVRFPLTIARGLQLDLRSGLPFAVSPDGKRIVYSGTDSSGVRRLLIRSTEQLEARVIPGTDGAVNPFFSPDGSQIGFVAMPSRDIKRIDLSDGNVSVITGTENMPTLISSPIWDQALGIVFQENWQLRHVSPSGGTSQPLTPARTFFADSTPVTVDPSSIITGAKYVLASTCTRAQATSAGCRNGVGVVDRETGLVTPIIEDAARAWLAASDVIVFARRDGSLFASRFDSKRPRLTGDPVSLGATLGTRIFAAAMSPGGTMVYVPLETGDDQVVIQVDRLGREQVIVDTPGPYSYLRLAPDGRRLALVLPDGSERPQVWIHDSGTGATSQLTFDSASARPSWSPDGRRVVVSRIPGLWVLPSDGSSPASRIDTLFEALAATSWTRDGRWILLDVVPRAGTGGVDDIFAIAPDGSDWKVVVGTPAQEQSPEVSPDGRWIAYVSSASGAQEVYVQPFMREGGRTLVSIGAAAEPAWLSNNELSYISTTSDSLVVARFAFEQGVRVTRTALFSVRQYVLGTPSWRNYDASRDGTRFYFARRAGIQPDPVVVVNGLADVRRKLGGR